MNCRAVVRGLVAIPVTAFWGCHSAPVAVGTTSISPLVDSVASGQQVFTPDEYWFRLVSYGIDGPRHFPLITLRGTKSCCDELRAGWMMYRGQYWVAVDTVAVRKDSVGFPLAGPFRVRVDSGMRRGIPDSTFYNSDVFRPILPTTGAFGVTRHDTLTLKSARRAVVGPEMYDDVRIYVRVRPN